ncbi:MAG: HNH nuclease family protein [Betaproteobacteria bacterium]|nr:HNH nuclease family protein [Betaproteobacteria bacterium]
MSPATPKPSYRDQALKLLPWICARCAREFPASRLRELTVHHKDGNHHHNPPEGSNWELLCIYCHENEHARLEDNRAAGGDSVARASTREPATHRPFAGLGKKLQDS